MAKRRNAGRKPKPTAKHKLDGTYREDRHGGRGDVSGDGVLIKPDGLEGLASWLWDTLESQLIAWGACESDSVAVGDMCRWWQSYRQCLEAGEVGDAAKAWDRFNSVACRFGLTLADRAKLQLPDQSSQDAREQKFYQVVG